MDGLHSLEHPFASHWSRIACIAISLSLLWYDTSQVSVAGLAVMFLGLVAVVRAALPPRPSLRTPAPHRLP